jgi:hypothetical protein
MARTETDLRDVLAERAAAMPADISLARVAAVGHRVEVIRRRRAASATLAVVILLLVVTGVSGLFRQSHDRTSPVPAYKQKVAGGLLPRYDAGGKATAYTSFSTDVKRETTFTFTPTSLAFLVVTACDKDMPDSQMVSYAVNGHPFISGTCSRGLNTAGPSYGLEQARATELGLKIGVPATVRVRVVQWEKGSKTAPEKLPVYRGSLADYRVAVAVYSPMPVDEYPLPPRPRKLETFDEGDGYYGAGRLIGEVDSRTVGGNGNGSVTATLVRKGIRVDMYAVAPGAVTDTVNDHTDDDASFRTWSGSGYGGLVLTPAALRKLGVDVKSGDRITVGFTGARFSVAGWRARVHESK